MFVGLVPLVLGILGYVWGRQRLQDGVVQLMAASLVGAVLLTLHVGMSAWQPLASLPLASAIRAVSRIELVLLFPLGYIKTFLEIGDANLGGKQDYFFVPCDFEAIKKAAPSAELADEFLRKIFNVVLWTPEFIVTESVLHLLQIK